MNTIRGTQPTVEQRPGVGDMIGRHRLIRLIAEGRSGPLFAAEWNTPNAGRAPDTIAVRCIRPELAHAPRFRESFVEAARVVARCQHPNIVNVLEMAEDQERYFVSMEYLPGESLAAILAGSERRAELTPDLAVHLVKRVASAVLHARAVGAALSPPVPDLGVEVDASNVVVTHSGAIKWLGVALPSAVDGTPSPAGVADDGRAIANALGELLWTCLAPSARTDIPDALAAIAMQAVTADPRERFQSIEAFSDALDRYSFGRERRPTTADVRRWLEGAEVPVRGPRPRPLWSASVLPPALLPSAPRRWLESLGRRWLRGVLIMVVIVVVIMVAIAGAIALGTARLPFTPAGVASAHVPQRSDRPETRLDIRSTPSDAAIFVDGEPTGLRTPVVLKGLPPDAELLIRVEKPGFAPQRRRVAIATGALESLAYELVASDGLVVFNGAPRGARFYVDGAEVAVNGQKPILLAVGSHAIRVEAAGELLLSDRVAIVPGEQTIRVTKSRAIR